VATDIFIRFSKRVLSGSRGAGPGFHLDLERGKEETLMD
jgi:hypothetical protein